jgi:hypothetical protein
MIPPTVQEAIDLYNSITSLTSTDGPASIKRQAQAITIVRDGEDWRIEMTQSDGVTLPSGKKITEYVAPITLKASELLTGSVTIDGKVWPLALVFASINQLYKDLAKPTNA